MIHSLLRLLTGFTSEAFIDWKLTVASVIPNAPDPAARKIQSDNGALYSYCCSQSCMKYQATGVAIAIDIKISHTKSFDSIFQRLKTVAPSTFRTPISLARCPAIKEASPKRPRQEMRMVSPVNREDSVAVRWVSANFSAYCSS